MNSDDLLERSKQQNSRLPAPQMPELTTLDVNGLTVFHLDVPPAEGGDQTYLLVHGLGGTHANWEPIIGQLSQHGRVLVPDLAGFGRTDATALHAGVRENADMLAAYCEAVGANDVVAVGNSMGGLIAALLAQNAPGLVRRLVLIDPALPLDPRAPSHPMVALVFGLYLCGPVARRIMPYYLARVGLERVGRDGVAHVVADPTRVPNWVYERATEETIAHAATEHSVATMVRAAQTIVWQVAGSSYRRVLKSLTVPVTLIHGDKDALVPVASARRAAAAHPSWHYVEAHDVGHVPMFEVADWVVAQVVEE